MLFCRSDPKKIGGSHGISNSYSLRKPDIMITSLVAAQRVLKEDEIDLEWDDSVKQRAPHPPRKRLTGKFYLAKSSSVSSQGSNAHPSHTRQGHRQSPTGKASARRSKYTRRMVSLAGNTAKVTHHSTRIVDLKPRCDAALALEPVHTTVSHRLYTATKSQAVGVHRYNRLEAKKQAAPVV